MRVHSSAASRYKRLRGDANESNLDCFQTPGSGGTRSVYLQLHAQNSKPNVGHSKAGTHLGTQLMRAVTSCGANYHEARGAESRRDFIHKLRIAHKEAEEALYWAQVAEQASVGPGEMLRKLISQVDEVCRMLAVSIRTARGGGRTSEREDTRPDTGHPEDDPGLPEPD